MDESILWRGSDRPGHDACRLFSADGQWQLSGVAVLSHEQQPCCLKYEVVADQNWKTVRAKVSGWVGKESTELELTVGPDLKWRVNGVEKTGGRGLY